MKKSLLGWSVIVMAFVAGANTVYVDCNLKDYAGHDGKSWETAYKTIQEGVSAAETDGVVLVAPGWYDEGGSTLGSGDAYLTNRVTITKRITVRSKEGRATRDSTFIVGRHASHSDDPKGLGMGLDAVRCVRFDFTSAVHGAVVEGFTLLNGSTHYNNGTYAMCSIGGGACFGDRTTSDSTASYLVDCVVSNCVATRGGGIYFGNAVRTRFTGNKASSNAPAVRDANLYYCLVDGANVGSSGVCYLGGGKAVNCTIANCAASIPLRGNSTGSGSQYTPCLAYNTVILHNVSGETSSCVALTNCATVANFFYWDNNKNSPVDLNGDCTFVDMKSHQFIAPATGDYRPLATGDLVGAGKAEWLKLIPQQFRYVDYDGNAVSETGTVCAGAITKPVTPTGGFVYFEEIGYQGNDQCSLFVNGYEQCVDKLYAFGLSEPAVYRLDVEMPRNPNKLATRHYFGCSLRYTYNDNKNSSTLYSFPLRGTRRHYIMGPPADTSLQVIPRVTEQVFWADASVPDGAEMDGSEAKPFNTLQAAVDAAETRKSYNVVYAKKGRYDKGGAFFGGLTNRVAITKGETYVRLYAVDGPQETFIVGKGDETSTHPFKYGDAAVRCFATCTSCAQLSGFTLTGGRVTLNNGAEDPGIEGLYGGGVFGGSGVTGYQVEDCIITNCAASRGAIAWRGVLRRCLVTDCTSTRLGALRGTVHASACVFKDVKTASSGSSDHILGQDEVAYNCSFASTTDNSIYPFGNNANTALYNSLVYRFKVVPSAASTVMEGSYYDACETVQTAAMSREGLTRAKMGFADLDRLDLALCSSSRPASGGNARNAGGDFWRYGSAVDFEGTPFVFGADGTMPAGAYQRMVPSVSVVTGDTGVEPAGESFLTADSPTVTLTATDAETRNFAGFYAGDELLSAETACAFTYDAAAAGTRLEVEARYVPYWYVDPKGDDVNNRGRSWTDAKRTLAEVMKLARPGDTVFAAPGVYDDGDDIQPKNFLSYSEPLLRARVYVPDGVALVSRDGAEATTILGRSATDTTDGYGGGTDALRCVYLGKDARLEGFTLSGGRAYGQSLDNPDDNNRGAGVHGWGDNPGEVRDCVITNCVAARGGGSTYVIAVNCRFLGNRCTRLCAASQHTGHHNCYFDYNYGSPTVGYWRTLRNSTIGVHNDAAKPLGTSPKSGTMQNPSVFNTLILSGGMVSGADIAFTNCAFTTDMLTGWSAAATTNETCICVPKELLQADENGVPLVGCNLAVDAGDTNCTDLALLRDVDLAGNPRRVNGMRMDIGCYEADWKSRYFADLGKRHASVTEASPAVCETASGSVALMDGTRLTLDFLNPRGQQCPQIVTFRVTGDGVLSLCLPGGETRTYTASADAQNYTFQSASTQTLDFSFAGAGSAELLSCRMESGSVVIIR